MPERGIAWAAVALLAALGGWSWLKPIRAPAVPPRVAFSAVEPWMADALPGIGPTRRARAVEALRHQRMNDLPAPAHAAAALVFVQP